MPTPTPAQASRHYVQQAAIAAAAVKSVWPLFRQRAPWLQINSLIGRYQQAAATAAVTTMSRWADADQMTDPRLFAGISSMGYPILEPIIATIDRVEPAPPEALPDAWWSDATLFQHSIELLIASEVADAARSASQVEMIGQGWTEYVRVLNPPSCPRCTILAGRRYRWSTGFQRHPGCDCQMVPVDDPRAANDLLTDPTTAFDAGQVQGLSKADARAITDGADPLSVINATRGTSAPGITSAKVATIRSGRTLKHTTEGITKRGAWRKANPSLRLRLRPESIYAFAGDDRDEAIRLLKVHGYIT